MCFIKEEETKKKKVTLKKSTHVTPNRFKVKKEEHIDVNENEIEMPDNDSNEIEEFSHDSCYGKSIFSSSLDIRTQNNKE